VRNYYVLFSDPGKKDVYEKIVNHKDFDYVCANPPYIGEKGHKELFRDTLKHYPYWENFYQGKMDYLYFFIELGLSKLREGGKLGFITTSYWPTADGASKLRKYILDSALIKEIIDFGETKIFEGAPGQHNVVFVLEKCSSYKNNGAYNEEITENIAKKKINRIKIVKVKENYETKSVREGLLKIVAHVEKHIAREEYSDEYIDVFLSPAKQGGLGEGAWNLMLPGRARTIIEKIKQEGAPLADMCEVNQGIVSGADKVTNSNIRLLSQDSISKNNIKPSDGIFVLSSKELASLRLPKEETTLIRPFYKNSDIDSYYIHETPEEQQFIIYTTKVTKIDQYPQIKAHLEKFRPILENKREFKEGKLPWFSLHWARDRITFESEKIVTPNRAPRNTFGYNKSSLYAMSDVFFITNRKQKESLCYITGLINSSLLDYYFMKSRKAKGKVREYVGTPLSEIPIRRIDFDSPKEVKIHNRLVGLVDEIIETKKQLAVYNKYYPVRLTRLEGADETTEPEDINIVADLPKSDLRLLRTHPEIRIDFKVQGVLLKGSQKEETLRSFCLSGISKIKKLDGGYIIEIMQKKKGASLVIHAPKELLSYLRIVLPADKGKRWEEISNEVLCPNDISMIKDKREKIIEKTRALFGKTEKLHAEIDELVYDLYGITKMEQKEIEKSLAK